MPSALWCTNAPVACTAPPAGPKLPWPVTAIQSPGEAIGPACGAVAVLGLSSVKVKMGGPASRPVPDACAAVAGRANARSIRAIPQIRVGIRRICCLRGEVVPAWFARQHVPAGPRGGWVDGCDAGWGRVRSRTVGSFRGPGRCAPAYTGKAGAAPRKRTVGVDDRRAYGPGW